MSHTLLMTTGDVDGIGLEVTVKALVRLGQRRGIHFVVWMSNETKKSHFQWALRSLKTKFTVAVFDRLSDALDDSSNSLKIVVSSRPPARWVEESALACLRGRAHALVTGPLSKPGIHAAGLKDVGHTEILQRLTKVKAPLMGFSGDQFSVVLATGHRPLATVPKALTKATLEQALLCANQLRNLLPAASRKQPIRFLGLNPHAGDQGLIGGFEDKVLRPFLKSAQRRGFRVQGPEVPDVAFRPDRLSKTSVFVALYHDQGLIPFKVVHGFSGVHLTLGLPIIRTSVDHGTASDIYGKNIANPASMLEAIKWAEALATKKKGRTYA